MIIVNHVLGHVDLRFSRLLSMQFWTQEVPDAFRVLRAVALLMREREPATSRQCTTPRPEWRRRLN